MKLDLQNNKYDMRILKKNIYALSLREILETQNIDEKFIVAFILNPDYQLTDDDKVTINDVLTIKKNINHKLLYEMLMNGVVDKSYTINFENFANDM